MKWEAEIRKISNLVKYSTLLSYGLAFGLYSYTKRLPNPQICAVNFLASVTLCMITKNSSKAYLYETNYIYKYIAMSHKYNFKLEYAEELLKER